MDTTEANRPPLTDFSRYSAYELVEALPEAAACTLTLRMAAELTAEYNRLRPLVERARYELSNHQTAASGTADKVREQVPGVDSIGIEGLLAALSGGDQLRSALCALRDLCDPDTIGTDGEECRR